MKPMPRRFCPIPPARMRVGLNLVGFVLLLVGFAAAGFIWRSQNGVTQSDQQAADPAAPLAPSDSRKQSRQIEIYYGKSGVLFERWSERLQSLEHGKPLAKAIVVVTCITAFGCFFVAARFWA